MELLCLFLVFKTNYRSMQVKSIAECSKGSILQYFRPSLSYHLSLGSMFCLFLSGHFTQVLVYFCFQPIVHAVGDPFYKITSEALLVTQQLVKVIRPLGKNIEQGVIPSTISLNPHSCPILLPAVRPLNRG